MGDRGTPRLTSLQVISILLTAFSGLDNPGAIKNGGIRLPRSRSLWLISLPPQREPRCAAVGSPLTPRSPVLTFLRCVPRTEVNPNMFFACFSAPPCLRVKKASPQLDAIPTRTEQSASRYVPNMPTSISPLFNHFQIRKAEIARLPCYTGSVGAVSCTVHRRAPPYAPAPPSASVQPVCVTKVCAITASHRKRML